MITTERGFQTEELNEALFPKIRVCLGTSPHCQSLSMSRKMGTKCLLLAHVRWDEEHHHYYLINQSAFPLRARLLWMGHRVKRILALLFSSICINAIFCIESLQRFCPAFFVSSFSGSAYQEQHMGSRSWVQMAKGSAAQTRINAVVHISFFIRAAEKLPEHL